MAAISRAELISYDCNFLPENDPHAPWSPTGTIDVPRWIENGAFFQHLIQGQWPLPHGEQDFYTRPIPEFAGVPSWFLEWRAVTDGTTQAFAVNGPSAVATAGGPTWYHFALASNELRFFQPQFGFLYFDLVPGIPYTFRLEIQGTQTFALFIDDDLVTSGVPVAPYPTTSADVVWGSRFYVDEHTTEWSYIRYGGPIPEASTGDFDTNGSIDLRDFFFFTEYLTSPDAPHAVGWAVGDMEPTNGDTDIDLADFAAFQGAFTGPP